MTSRLRSAIAWLRHVAQRQRSRFTVRMTTHCCDQTTRYLRKSAQRGHEGIVYYVGVTNGLVSRVYQHKRRLVPGFTAKYNVTWLAYHEQTTDVRSAIQRERRIKSWRRSKKVALVESFNPQWQDLSLEWYDGC